MLPATEGSAQVLLQNMRMKCFGAESVLYISVQDISEIWKVLYQRISLNHKARMFGLLVSMPFLRYGCFAIFSILIRRIVCELSYVSCSVCEPGLLAVIEERVLIDQ